MKSWKLLIPFLAAQEEKVHMFLTNTFNIVDFVSEIEGTFHLVLFCPFPFLPPSVTIRQS